MRVGVLVQQQLQRQVLAQLLAQQGKGKRALSREEATRKACADMLCAHLALFWRREDLNDPGEYPPLPV